MIEEPMSVFNLIGFINFLRFEIFPKNMESPKLVAAPVSTRHLARRNPNVSITIGNVQPEAVEENFHIAHGQFPWALVLDVAHAYYLPDSDKNFHCID